MTEFFHVAAAVCRDDILRECLVPDPFSLEEQEPGVYVWQELADAARRCVREFEQIRGCSTTSGGSTRPASAGRTTRICFNAFFSCETVPPAQLALAVPADLDGWD